jgi:hypothetical protein
MSLEGNLRDFSLAEILQLISVQQKSGMLTVHGENPTIFFFRDGNIVSVRDRRRKSRDPLKDYIAHVGVLKKDDLIRASRMQADTRMDLADILVSEEFLEEPVLERVLLDLIQDTTYRALSESGDSTYRFVAGTGVLQGIVRPVCVKVDAVLMESMRRIDEYPRHLEALPEPNIVLGRTDEDSDAEKLEGREREVWDGLEEDHPLTYLLSNLGMPHYEVYENAHLLLEKGLIHVTSRPRVVTVEEPSVPVAPTAPEERDRAGGGRSLLYWSLVLFAVAASGLVGRLAGARHFGPAIHRAIEARSLFEQGDIGEARDRADLDLLAERELLTASLLDRAEERGWRYRLTFDGEAYTLSP